MCVERPRLQFRPSFVGLALAATLAAHVSATWAQPSAAGTGEGTGEEPQAVLTGALAAFDRGERAAASSELLAWLAANPDHPRLALEYTAELRARRAFDETLGFLRDYVALREAAGSPDTAAALELGTLLLTLLRYEEAVPYLERVPPGDALPNRLAQLNLAKAYRALGRFEEARRAYQPAVHSSSAVFAQGGLCEVALALEGPEAARTCIAEGRVRYGAHAAFEQPEILATYLDGDFAQATALLDAAAAQGGLSARLIVLRPLLILEQSGPEVAMEAALRVDQITAHGERDALAAAVAARAGDLQAAAIYYSSALEQNDLFADPAETGRVLFWRPEVVADLERARAAVGGAREPEGTGGGAVAAEGTGGSHGPGTPVRRDETGCCGVAASEGRGPGWWVAVLAWGWLRTMRRRRPLATSSRAHCSPARPL